MEDRKLTAFLSRRKTRNAKRKITENQVQVMTALVQMRAKPDTVQHEREGKLGFVIP